MNNVLSYVKVETKLGNSYIYNINNKSLMYLHPIMQHIVNHYYEKIHQINCLEIHQQDDYLQKIKLSEVIYYVNKLRFLLNTDIFAKSNFEQRIGVNLHPEVIEDRFATTNHISFEVTEKCNLSCVYCIYQDMYEIGRNSDSKSMNFTMIKNVIDYKIKYWNSTHNKSGDIVKLISFYGGEPLLNFKVIQQAVHYIEETFKFNSLKWQFNITTNGILLKQHVKFLVDHNFRIAISLDGPEFANQYRVFKKGMPAYDIIIEAVMHVKKNYSDFFDANVDFLSVYHDKSNFNEIKNFFKLYIGKENSFSELHIGAVKNRKLIKKITDTPINRIVDYSMFSKYNYIFYNELITNKVTNKILPTGTCVPFSKMIFVTSQGNVLMCESISHSFNIGIVTNSSIQLRYREFAQQHSQRMIAILKQCKICHNQASCKQCIYTIDVNKRCPLFLNKRKYKIYISNHIDIYEENK